MTRVVATPRILVFFPYNPCPPRHGAHRRCLELLAAMRELGWEVVFASSARTSDSPWGAADRDLREQGLARRVVFHRPSIANQIVNLPRRYLAYRALRAGRLGLALRSPPSMRRWFARTIAEVGPDALFMFYAHWDLLVPEGARRAMVTVIDAHDLVSVNLRMQEAIRRALGLAHWRRRPLRVADAPDRVLREDFFRTAAFEVHPEELEVYDRYEHTLTISEQEAGLIRQACPRTRTHFIPMTQQVVRSGSSCDGPPVYPLGPNLFNVQGYLYFARRVLPEVLRKAPAFRLQVTGSFARNLRIEAPRGIQQLGFVDDFSGLLEQAAFVVSPVFGGTGQQVKIVEAMAHGLPVVALRDAADRSPLEHGVSGLVADDAAELADHVLTLWGDRRLCRRMGEAGRRKVAEHLDHRRLARELSKVLSGARRQA